MMDKQIKSSCFSAFNEFVVSSFVNLFVDFVATFLHVKEKFKQISVLDNH